MFNWVLLVFLYIETLFKQIDTELSCPHLMYLLYVGVMMSEQWCEVLENATVQYKLSLVTTTGHNVPYCMQCWGLEGKRKGEGS